MTRLSRRTLAAAGTLMGALALVVVLTGGLVGIERLWPVLLGAAVGLAPGVAMGRVAAVALGALAGWVGVWLRLTVLPDTPAGRAVAGAVVLAVVVAVAVASRDRVPLWAALVGAAAFLAFTEATVGVGPTAFPVEHLGVLGALMVGLGAGAVAAVAARALLALLATWPVLRRLAQRRVIDLAAVERRNDVDEEGGDPVDAERGAGGGG